MVEECCRNFPGKVLLGLDAHKGLLAIRGWEAVSSLKATEVVRRFEGLKLKALIFTDIQRDGMLTGPNLPALLELLQATDLPVIASGGIASIENVEALLPLEGEGLRGIIIGKSLYSGKLDLREVLEFVEKRRHAGKKDHSLPGCQERTGG